MRILVDTGVFSASISRRRRARFESQVGLLAGNQLFLAAVTVGELRYGALVAGWGDLRRQRLEESVAATTVVPVSDALLTTAAELRHACRQVGMRSTSRSTPTTYGSQLPQFTSVLRSSPPTRCSTASQD